MNRRLQLHAKLIDVLGTSKAYFQPPESIRMDYPCIVYHRDKIDTKYADNIQYLNKKRYTVTVIDKNPDSEIPGRLSKLPLCKFDRHYTKDNLNHDVYNIYY